MKTGETSVAAEVSVAAAPNVGGTGAETPVVAPQTETTQDATLLTEEAKPELDTKSLLDVDGEAKSEETTEEKDEVPEGDYELKFEEGMELDAGLLDSFKSLAKELKLGNKAAQKLVDMVASHAQKALKEQRNKELETIAGFKKEILADPKHKELINDAQAAVRKFAGDNEMFKELTKSWVGNHPGFVRFLASIGSHLREADMVSGSASGEGGQKQDLGSILYPDMAKKK